MSSNPILMKLPSALVERRFTGQTSSKSGRSNRAPHLPNWPLLPCFTLNEAEKCFVRQLLRKKSNLWLFRCNQQAFCGDFVAVDMSSRSLRCRQASVLELKSRLPLKLGGSGAGYQFHRTQSAVDELVGIQQILSVESPIQLACGSATALLSWMGVSVSQKSDPRKP